MKTQTSDRVLAIGLSVLICSLTACATQAQRAELHAQQALTQCLMQKGGNPNICARQLAALGAQCHVEKIISDDTGRAVPTHYVWACKTAHQLAAVAPPLTTGFTFQNGGDWNGPVPNVGPVSMHESSTTVGPGRH
jgi:hypothetical protein